MDRTRIPKATARDWPLRGTAVCRYGYFVMVVPPALPPGPERALAGGGAAARAAGEGSAATGSNS